MFSLFEPQVNYYFDDNNDELAEFQIENDVNCLICFSNLGDIYRIKDTNMCLTNYLMLCDCNGYYHKECLLEWFRKSRTCPICRSDVIFVSSDYNDCNYLLRMVAKMLQLVVVLTIFQLAYAILFTIGTKSYD
jgi:E3 ubiquitin-protein ligase DOA10